MSDDGHPPAVTFWLRFAAIFYDAIALGAVLFFAAGLVVAAAGRAVTPGDPLFTAYLLAVSYVYFAYCWVRGGQTLGMRTWKIALISDRDGRRVSWGQSVIRFFGALLSWSAFGIGFVSALFDPDGRAWHDRWSGSRLVRI